MGVRISMNATKFESAQTLLTDVVDTAVVRVGESTASAREFYAFRLPYIAVNIFSAGHGTTPQLVEVGRCVLVGFDLQVAVIDDAKVAATIPLAGVFYEFQDIAGTNDVLVVHELGVMRQRAMSTIWAIETDIVADITLSDGRCLLRLMDPQETCAYDLADGRRLA